MEDSLLPEKEIRKILKETFICAAFYVDDKTPLPDGEHFVSKRTGKPVTTAGKKHLELQIEKFQVNFQPFFVIIDSSGTEIARTGYEPSKEKFLSFLNTARPRH
jgi:thiol:disulfide interchange protein DsbD